MKSRCFFLLLLLSGFRLVAAEPERSWPLWDGKESVADYARRVNLPPAKTIDLGNNIQLEMVLIPAGEFVMGAAKPNIQEPEREAVGIAILAIGIVAFLALYSQARLKAIRAGGRTQFSLAQFMLMIFALAVGAYGGVRWRAERIAWDNYRLEMARFERAYPEEKPAHQVTISKPFYMGKYEVTQAQYQQVVGKLKESFRGANFPAGNLSWYECLDFCRLNSQTLMRLPTEAEWEFACRAGTDTDFGPGNAAKDLESVAWCPANSGGASHAVGTKDPNTFGLCDMHGNQFEWTGDCYSDYALGAVTDPSSSPAAPRSVPMALRGGSVIDGPDCCRATTRLGKVNSTRHPLFGFRVVTPIDTTQK